MSWHDIVYRQKNKSVFKEISPLILRNTAGKITTVESD